MMSWFALVLAEVSRALDTAQRPDAELGDLVADAAHDVKTEVVEYKALTLGGDGLGLVEDEAGDYGCFFAQ